MRNLKHSSSKGFTVVEILVVAPIIVLVVGAIIGVIIYMTGDVLATRAANLLTYNVQDAMERIEQDTSRSGAYLATNNLPIVSPQGLNDDDTEFVNASAEGDALILNVYASTDNPSTANAGFVYIADYPHACGSEEIAENGTLMFNVVYFVKDSTLWRRVVVPANYDSLGCQATWQRPSCSPGVSASICVTNDIRLVDGVTDFSIDYYDSASSTEPNAIASDPEATNSERAEALEGTATIRVNIEAEEAVAGRTVRGGAGVIAVSPNNDTSNTLPEYSTPNITQNPQDEYLVDGETANFSVAVEGYPVPSVQWQVSTNQGSNWADIEGATGDDLELANVLRSQDGNLYRAAVSNSEGSVNSQVARLNVGDSQWQALTLNNSWNAYTSGYNVSYIKTRSGVVVVRGMVKHPGTPTASTAIATLPAGYRPSDRLIFSTISNSASSRIDVLTTGAINFQTGSGTWLALDGVSFIPGDSAYDVNAITNFSNGWENYGSSYADASYVVDNIGRVHLEGLVKSGVMTNNTLIFAMPSNLTPSGYMHLPSIASGNAFSLYGIGTTTSNSVIAKGVGTSGFYTIQGMYHPSSVGNWTNLTLQNGWTTYGGSFSTPQYTKDSDNIVKLKGLLSPGTTTAGTVIANLPLAYRPENHIVIRSVMSNALARVDIGTNGNITIQLGSGSWLSLDGIQFVKNN